MRYGLAVPHFGPTARPGFVESVAREAESLGYDSLWASDHIIVPAGAGYTPHFFYDIFITMTVMAMLTERVTVGSSVLVVPYRDPVMTARMVATLDQLSGGRVVLAVGAGGFEPEFRALGADYEARGEVTDEYLDCMRALWTLDPVSFEGKRVRFSGMRQNPKPVQDPLPVWVGGNTRAAIRRAAGRGNGWHPINLGLEEFREKVGAYREACAAAGVEPGPVSLRTTLGASSGERVPFTGGPAEVASDVDAYAAAGLDELVLALPARSVEEYQSGMRDFAEEMSGT